jgi:hypothetical protein
MTDHKSLPCSPSVFRRIQVEFLQLVLLCPLDLAHRPSGNAFWHLSSGIPNGAIPAGGVGGEFFDEGSFL